MKIFFTSYFKKQLKRLLKKFPSVTEDLLRRIENIDLRKEIYIGNSVYKVRVASSDQNKGKSGGFRAYLYLYSAKSLLVPLCIYPKSYQEIVTDEELRYHVYRAMMEF